MNHRTCIWAFIVAPALSQIASAANIDVFQMGMTTSVLVDGQHDSEYVLAPTNPLMTTRHAKLGLTEATTVFDLAWSPTGGRFDFLFDHVIDDTDDFADSTTSGNLGITSDVNLWLDYEYSYTYHNLTGDISIRSNNRLRHATDDGIVYLVDDVQRGGAGILEPPTGTLSFAYQVLLEAGELYSISYSTSLDAGLETGAIGSGTGSLHFTLTPVPEPASAALCALAIAAWLCRRQRI